MNPDWCNGQLYTFNRLGLLFFCAGLVPFGAAFLTFLGVMGWDNSNSIIVCWEKWRENISFKYKSWWMNDKCVFVIMHLIAGYGWNKIEKKPTEFTFKGLYWLRWMIIYLSLLLGFRLCLSFWLRFLRRHRVGFLLEFIKQVLKKCVFKIAGPPLLLSYSC